MEKPDRELQIEELKRLIEILPELKLNAMRFELAYRKESGDNIGRQENGYVYHVRPTVYENYLNSQKEYSDMNDRRWELIKKLRLNCSIKGIPDFGESTIKPYGYDRVETRDYLDNRQIGTIY